MPKKFVNPQRETPQWISAAEVEPRDIKWLWYPYIPYGTITALYGRGGMGKSQITCDIASRLSNGSPLPGQPINEKRKQQNILMLSAEDDYAEVLVPRLMRAGADRSRIFIPKKPFVLDPSGIGWMQDAMADFDTAVVFIDPIVYFTGGKMDINKANEVRAMMEKLRSAAASNGSAIMIVGHIRKSQEGQEGDQMMGSADWINAARSGLFATQTNDGTRILKNPKNNYGPNGTPISYFLDDKGFHWGDLYEDSTPTGAKPGTKIAEAREFIKTLLADGPEPAVMIKDAAKEAGITAVTLDRAKSGLVESYFNRSAGAWYWRLKTSEGDGAEK